MESIIKGVVASSQVDIGNALLYSVTQKKALVKCRESLLTYYLKQDIKLAKQAFNKPRQGPEPRRVRTRSTVPRGSR